MIEPRHDVLLVEKIENSQLSVDMVVAEEEDDKNLIVCKVVEWTTDHWKDSLIVVWKYSLYKLVYLGETFFFVEGQDIVAKIK